jgi:hypothetical protein
MQSIRGAAPGVKEIELNPDRFKPVLLMGEKSPKIQTRQQCRVVVYP